MAVSYFFFFGGMSEKRSCVRSQTMMFLCYISVSDHIAAFNKLETTYLSLHLLVGMRSVVHTDQAHAVTVKEMPVFSFIIFHAFDYSGRSYSCCH